MESQLLIGTDHPPLVSPLSRHRLKVEAPGGAGWAVAIGRLGAVAGPLMAGIILSAGQGTAGVMMGVLPVILVPSSPRWS